MLSPLQHWRAGSAEKPDFRRSLRHNVAADILDINYMYVGFSLATTRRRMANCPLHQNTSRRRTFYIQIPVSRRIPFVSGSWRLPGRIVKLDATHTERQLGDRYQDGMEGPNSSILS